MARGEPEHRLVVRPASRRSSAGITLALLNTTTLSSIYISSSTTVRKSKKSFLARVLPGRFCLRRGDVKRRCGKGLRRCAAANEKNFPGD